jgi:hypothetical protein
MTDNTATTTRAAIEKIMTGLSEDDDVYGALAACQARLNAIAWNRFAAFHQQVQQAKRRATFRRRHQQYR